MQHAHRTQRKKRRKKNTTNTTNTSHYSASDNEHATSPTTNDESTATRRLRPRRQPRAAFFSLTSSSADEDQGDVTTVTLADDATLSDDDSNADDNDEDSVLQSVVASYPKTISLLMNVGFVYLWFFVLPPGGPVGALSFMRTLSVAMLVIAAIAGVAKTVLARVSVSASRRGWGGHDRTRRRRRGRDIFCTLFRGKRRRHRRRRKKTNIARTILAVLVVSLALLGVERLATTLYAWRIGVSHHQISVITHCSHYSGWTETSGDISIFDVVVLKYKDRAEVDALRARVHELSDVVRTFIVVEPYEETPLFDANAFEEYDVLHAPVRVDANDDFDLSKAVVRVLWDAPIRPDDLVVLGRTPEDLPRAEVLGQLKACEGWQTPVELRIAPYVYDFGCVVKQDERSATIVRLRDLEESCDGYWDGFACAHELGVEEDAATYRPHTVISDAGWSMRHFAPIETVRARMRDDRRDVVDCMVDACVSPEGIVGTRQRRVVPRGPAWVRAQTSPAYAAYYRRDDTSGRFEEAALRRTTDPCEGLRGGLGR